METKGIWRTIIPAGLLIICCALAEAAPAADGPQAPSNLRCEYLTNPAGIDVTHPRFSWVLEHGARGETQSAYQVLVTTRADSLQKDLGDQWDSGKVSSDDSTQVSYQGKPLVSGQSYFWKVKYWDKEGNASPYSEAAEFDTGLLSRE